MAEDDERGGGHLGQVQSLVRAFGLLDELSRFDDGLTLTEIAKLTKLPRSTAHRLLTTMDALRYVEFDSTDNRWRIGIQAFTLGTAFVQVRDIGRLGRPIMRSLVLEANEVVNIAVSDVTGVRYVGQVRPLADRSALSDDGKIMPMHTTASGKVLLAHWQSSALDAFLGKGVLARRTNATIVEKPELVRQLDEIRSRGYAIDDQENVRGRRCVSAPVFDRNGSVRASLTISGDMHRLPNERLSSLGRTLVAAASRMTGDLGGVLAADLPVSAFQ